MPEIHLWGLNVPDYHPPLARAQPGCMDQCSQSQLTVDISHSAEEGPSAKKPEKCNKKQVPDEQVSS